MPLQPFLLRHVEVVFEMAQEFHFHDVDLVDGNSRYLRPSLVGIGVVIEDYEDMLAYGSRYV